MVFLFGLLVLLRVLVTWLKLLLVVTLLGWLLNGVTPDEYDQVAVASLVPDHPNVWSDGSLVLDKVTGISSSGAGFFADSLSLFGMIDGWVRLILSALGVMFSPVEVSVLFQGLFSLSEGLRCGESSWLCSLLVLFSWVLTISVLFVMLGVCLMVLVVTVP